MPRLVGKQSSGGLSVGLILLVSVGVLGVLEYFGAIDFVPNFGLERGYLQGNQMPESEPGQALDNSQ